MARSRRAAAASDVQLLGGKAAARDIADVRARFNQALADRDLDIIGQCLAENSQLVPGDEAALIDGRDAQIDAWKSVFTNMPDVAYMRTPQRIEVSSDGELAAETGRWRGSWSTDGFQVSYSGRYLAKWRREALIWQIEAEVFVTLKRQGG